MKTALYTLLLMLASDVVGAQVTFRLLDPPRSGLPHDFSLSYGGESMGCILQGAVYWWTDTEGFRFIDAGTPQQGGVGLSASGNALVASRRQGAGTVATIWYQDGTTIDLDPIREVCETKNLSTGGFALSGDGTTAVINDSDCETEHGFVWNARSGARPLMDAASGSRAVDCSADGTTTVGFSEDVADGLRHPMLWRRDSGPELILDPQVDGEALDISQDGRWVVGKARLNSLNPQGFLWQAGETPVNLGSLSGRITETSRACAVSDDGKVVGWSGDAMWDNQEAFVWVSGQGMRSLADVLVENGVKLPRGLLLTGALDISGDGTVLVGMGRDANWNLRYWRVELAPGMDLMAGSAKPSSQDKTGNQPVPDSMEIQHGQLLPTFPFGKRRIQQ